MEILVLILIVSAEATEDAAWEVRMHRTIESVSSLNEERRVIRSNSKAQLG